MELLDYIKYYDDRIDMLEYRNKQLQKEMERYKILLDSCLSAMWCRGEKNEEGEYEFEFLFENYDLDVSLSALFPDELKDREHKLMEHYKLKETAKKHGDIKLGDGEEDD